MDERVPQRSRERGNEDFPARLEGEVLAQPAEEDAGIGPDAGLGVRLRLGEIAQEVVVQDTVGQLRRDEQDGLDGRFADDGDYVCEAGDLA